MQMNEFRMAKEFALKYGCKSMVHGDPGVGKTPVVNTAPRPVLGICEPGMLSMRNSTIAAIDLFTVKRIDDWFAWIKGSHETRHFDTIALDSASELCEIKLRELQAKGGHGLKIYGEMADWAYGHFNMLFFLPQKHIYLISKQGYTLGEPKLRAPYFPGKDLNVRIPHMYDVILHMAVHAVPGVGQVKAFRTAASFEAVARDRSGSLAEFEPCDLTALFRKVMS